MVIRILNYVLFPKHVEWSFLSSELFSALFPFSFDARAKYKQILFLMSIFHISKVVHIVYHSLGHQQCFCDFQNEFMDQIKLMQDLDLNINHYKEKSVRSVVRIPIALKDLLLKKEFVDWKCTVHYLRIDLIDWIYIFFPFLLWIMHNIFTLVSEKSVFQSNKALLLTCEMYLLLVKNINVIYISILFSKQCNIL